MKPDTHSKFILRESLSSFPEFLDKGEFNNQEYLEHQITKLEAFRTVQETTAKDPRIQPRRRARARDLAQNASGLVHGIKFALSFMAFKEQDLLEMEGLSELLRLKKDKQ